MYLNEIIAALETVAEKNPDLRVKYGFDPARAHSWRGSYSELSFPPARDVLLVDMLAGLEEALGRTFEGYKGGDFTMSGSSEVYMDPYGECPGNRITSTVIRYWLDSLEEIAEWVVVNESGGLTSTALLTESEAFAQAESYGGTPRMIAPLAEAPRV